MKRNVEERHRAGQVGRAEFELITTLHRTLSLPGRPPCHYNIGYPLSQCKEVKLKRLSTGYTPGFRLGNISRFIQGFPYCAIPRLSHSLFY